MRFRQLIPMVWRHRRLAAAAAVSPALAAGLTLGAPAQAVTGSAAVISPESSSGIAGWTQTGSYLVNSLTAAQGVAAVNPPGGSPYELYRGDASVPASLYAQGWTPHAGAR
jgi:hypothetical protein